MNLAKTSQPIDFQVEQNKLDIGIVALTDCAPLVMAKHLGLFEQWGLDVTLHIQHSWATLRDRLHANLLDAAQVLAPMPLSSSLGLNGAKCDLITAFNLSMNGNGITLAASLFEQIIELNDGQVPELPLDAKWMAKLIEQRQQLGGEKLKFAAVYPFSCHFYQLRDWLADADIDVDRDIEIVIIPPTNMTEALQNNEIDGFCVGTPWNAKAVRAGMGVTVITSNDIWQDAPEKVLAVTKQWQQANPNTFIALMAAVQQACDWLVSTANRFETARILEAYLDESLDVIAPSLIGSCLTMNGESPRDIPAYNRFVSDGANMPKKSQGQSILKKMREAGQLDVGFGEDQIDAVLTQVYRDDLYQDMVAVLNQYGDGQ